MYPSQQKPYAGIFVKNQFERLRHLMPEDTVELFYMKRSFTSMFGSIVKYASAILRFVPLMFRKYDVIHVHFFYPLILLAWAYKMVHPSCKVVVTFHGTDISRHITSKRNKKLYSAIIRKTDYIIAVGKDLAREVEEKLKRKVDTILSAGVDGSIFYRLKDFSEKKYDFIFVGSFIKRKGLDILLETIRNNPNKHLKFCFVGSGELVEEIRKLSPGYNITLFENQTQDKLRELYNQSKFFVLPSRDEPFGLVVTEALFCGTPAIVSSSGGLKEQVRNSENGYIVETNNKAELGKVMDYVCNLSNQDYQQLVNNALSSNKEYELNYICHQLKRIYYQLV